MSELQRLIFQDILPPEILDKLCNISDLGDDDSYMDDVDRNSRSADNKRGKGRGRSVRPSELSESKESEDRAQSFGRNKSPDENEDEDKYNDGFSIEDSDGEEQSERRNLDNSLQIDSQSDNQSRLSRTPNTGRKIKKGKVQFSDSIRNDKPNGNSTGAYRSVDLSTLYKTKNELVYRLTELYLPTTKGQQIKMNEYNREKMITQNDIENEVLRTRKRKLKEEIKQVKGKLKHQIKYCNPSPLLEDAYYMYTPGMNTRQIDMIRDRNKYNHAPHIGRILPQKRHINQQQIAEQQRTLQQQSLETKHQKQESELKSYMLEDQYGLQDVSMIQELELEMSKEEHIDLEYKRLEAQYFEVSNKVVSQGLSLADLNQHERECIKRYLKQQASVVVESKYPLLKLTNLEKQCYTFMKHLNTDDFSYKGQKSAIQSDDTGMFMDDFIGAGNNNNNNTLSHPIFGITHTSITDDRLSQLSDHTFGKDNYRDKTLINDKELVSDFQLQEWITEQKYKQIEHSNLNTGGLAKRRKYWGEPVDSSSIRQVQKDNHVYKEFQNRKYVMRSGKDEKIFKIDRVMPVQHQGKSKKGAEVQEQVQAVDSHQIKDIKEYEYFKQQEQHFYHDNDKKVNINSIMRGVQLEMGMITEEEFYAQEELEDQIELSTNASVSQYGSKSHQTLLKDPKQPQTKSSVLTSVQTQHRKEQILSDFVDNFDVHFERRKKELHEVMLKKIQQHEKANQQTTGTGQQQTVAYASGSHALLQASGGMDGNKNMEGNRDKIKYMVNMSKLREDQEYGHNINDQHNGNQDEEMIGDEHNQPSRGQNDGLIGDDNMRLRVTKSRANELNHAKCILKLTYTRFDWSESALLNFHRPNINDVFEQIQYERDRQMQMQNSSGTKSTSTFVFSQGQLRLQERQDPMSIQMQNDYNSGMNLFVQMAVRVISNEQIDKRPKKVGIINAHDFFRDRYKLSLKDGKFCVFEHIDQQPLFVNDFGMASKLKRYLYSDKFLPDSAFLKRRENQGTRHMGPHGVQILKKKGEKIPLLGQIDTKYYKGITVMENNMYYCPVFYHKPQRNDFFCVLHRDKNSQNTIIVRELSELYVMGQEEPKLEVYNPQSRQYQHFIKRRTQAYVIRFLQENGNYISFQELNKFFPYINDQILKKIIKEINVEVDRNQYCSLSQEYNDEQFRQLITPENICQYESAQYGEQMLKKVGIRDITNADKISYATNKFCSEEPNQKKQLIARIIEEEVLSTPWNLSQNFIHNKQTRGMMMLEGIGDPSHGCGGYSYLKLPLKISQDSLNKAKINRMYLNPAIQNPKAVTGTDADLRKLSKKEIKNKLIDLGFKEESIATFTRWEMVALLRDKSSQAVSQGMEGEMKKFARGVRFTSKKQREMYQKQVNDIFKKQMGYLSKESGDFIQDYSDSETRDQRQKKINDIQQMNNNYSKNIVELKEDIEVKNIRDIPNFEILIMANQALIPASQNPAGSLNIGSNSGLGGSSSIQTGYDPNTGVLDRDAAAQALRMRLNEGMTYKCTILRKKIKPVNSQSYSKSSEQYDMYQQPDKIERVIFCSDPRQIKGFNKRKHKHEVKTKRTKKTSLKEKMQTSKPIIDDFKDRQARSETSSQMRLNQMGSSQMGTLTQHSGEPVKIKLGNIGGIVPDARIHSSDYSRTSTFQPQAQSSSFSINLSQISQSKPVKQQRTFQRFQNQEQLASKPFDQISEESGIGFNMGSRGMIQEPAKIAISLNLQDGQFETAEQRSRSKQIKHDDKKKIALKQKKPQPSKFAGTNYNDEDFESYKPKTQTSRRRQQSGLALLNEIFSNVIDYCIVYDRTKLFHYPVKKKDAPNYYDVIKNPIALTDLKNKAKRQDYQTREQFMEDVALLRHNAEIYNGSVSQIAQLAREIEQHANEKLNEVESDIKNFEMLVQEQQNSTIKI